jgi:hypothetical protein
MGSAEQVGSLLGNRRLRSSQACPQPDSRAQPGKHAVHLGSQVPGGQHHQAAQLRHAPPARYMACHAYCAAFLDE